MSRMAGFTMIEMLVVLTVTGVLFAAIATSLAGRQNSAEFTHASQNVQARIQQAIDQVSNGFYPSSDDFTCTNAGGRVQFSNVESVQGTNRDCVFLGKVMQFAVRGASPEQYQIYTIAGLRGETNGSTSPFQTVDPTVVGIAGEYSDYASPGTLEYGLTTAWMRSGGTDIGAVGFLMEPGSLDASGTGNYSAGLQQIDLIPLPGTALNQTIAQSVTAIDNELNDANLTANAPINPASGVQICFVSAGTSQSALITIGGSGRQLSVNLGIKGNRTCS